MSEPAPARARLCRLRRHQHPRHHAGFGHQRPERARATLGGRLPDQGITERPPAPNSPAEADMVDRLSRAWEAADVDGVIALLAEDVWLRMPPMPLEYQGRDLAAAFLSTVAVRSGRTYRFVPTPANGAPAFGVYQRDLNGSDAHAVGLLAVTLAGGLVAALTRFDNAVLARFGLPRSLPGTGGRRPE